jgi:hypothetical protein
VPWSVSLPGYGPLCLGTQEHGGFSSLCSRIIAMGCLGQGMDHASQERDRPGAFGCVARNRSRSLHCLLYGRVF